MLFINFAASAQSSQNVEIAVALSLSGDGISFGQPTLEGIQLAIEEANARGEGPHINLTVYDDQSSDDEAAAIAEQIAASPAVLMLGPSFSTASLVAVPAYADAGHGLSPCNGYIGLDHTESHHLPSDL